MSTTDVPGWGPATPGPAAFSITGPAQVEVNNQTRQGATSYTVTNLTGRPVRARLLPQALQGADPSWITTVGPPEVPMAVGATVTVTLNILVPPTAPGGNYLLRLDVVPEDDTEAEVEGPAVSFAVPAGAAPKGTPKWLLPLIIGILVLILAGGAGAYFVFFRNKPSGPPTTSPTPSSGLKWSAWEDLGGSYSSSPVATSWGPNRLDVFAQAPGQRLIHQGFNGTWAPADDLGPAIVGAPGAASWGANRIDAFVRGTDNQLWEKAWIGSWTTYIPLGGGELASSPSVATWGPNRLDVFVKGTDNGLWHRWWDGSAWSAYEPLGGNLEGAPAAVSRGPNLLDVFFRGRDNHLYQKSFDGTKWLALKDLGTGLDSDVAASSWGANRIDLFAEGDNNTVLHRFWDGNSWSGWETIASGVDDPPAAVSWGPNRIDLFARSTNNELLHMTYS